MKKCFLFFFVSLVAAATDAFAQGNGSQGITDATTMVTSYFEPAVRHEAV